MIESRKYRFLGMNVRGTPSMPLSAVKHDIGVFEDECDLGVLQEYRWPWYWRAVNIVLERVGENRWRTLPSRRKGLAQPVFGAQACAWKAEHFAFIKGKVDVLHKGHAGISEMRFLRAALLRDRDTGIEVWIGTTHFVVGGDEATDSRLRKQILREDIARLDDFLRAMVASGHPIMFQLDANIHPGTWAYVEFMKVLRKHGARVHGHAGVEYLFTINGKRADIKVERDWIVPTSRLRTDHEGRGITFRLIERENS